MLAIPNYINFTKRWWYSLNNPDLIHSSPSSPFKVSKCSEEIKNYIEERSGEDPLVKGIPEDKNPFKEKGSCIIS